MAQFVVPKFIEREPKIVGPFTFGQFIFVGGAGAICFVLYFTLPFHYFLLVTIFLMSGALALALVKIGGRSLPIILTNFFKFSISQKIFIWERKTLPPKVIEKREIKKEEIEEKPLLRIAEKSRLKELSTQIETKTR